MQALTYRVGHHSTSDDSTMYRPIDEIEHWRTARDRSPDIGTGLREMGGGLKRRNLNSRVGIPD
jgi:TPP-dependent pyruvate/acetoin dehydrogenase alpha subunit